LMELGVVVMERLVSCHSGATIAAL
jgi:hypothetical protein